VILVAFLLVSDRFPSQGLHIPPTYPFRYTTMLKLNPLTPFQYMSGTTITKLSDMLPIVKWYWLGGRSYEVYEFNTDATRTILLYTPNLIRRVRNDTVLEYLRKMLSL